MSRNKWNYKFNLLGRNFVQCLLSKVCLTMLVICCKYTLSLVDIVDTNDTMPKIDNNTIGYLTPGHIFNVTPLSNTPYTESFPYKQTKLTTASRYVHADNAKMELSQVKNIARNNGRKNHFGSNGKKTVDKLISSECKNNTVLHTDTMFDIVPKNKVAKDCMYENVTERNISDCHICSNDDLDNGNISNKSSEHIHVKHIVKNNLILHNSKRTPLQNKSSFRGNANDGEKPINTERNIIHVGGLFELSGSRSKRLGISELTSAELAADQVNEADFLMGYKLKLIHNDTRVSTDVL